MATDRFIPRVESYRSYLRVLAYSLMQRSPALRGKLDVSDIVQDVLLQAHTALTQFQGNTEAEFAAWLRTTLANKWTDAIRRYGRGKRDTALEESIRETLDSSTARLHQLLSDGRTSPSRAVLRKEGP
jgi:RNA polymerase sigma-70 factor (ECF subfamily)